MTTRTFHLDRAGQLSPGQVLGLTRHAVSPPEVQDHLDLLFPNGVSLHGWNYFAQGGTRATEASWNIELIWEYSRRFGHPDRPSRFESVFAWPTEQDAVQWLAAERQRGNPWPAARIWEVEADSAFRADMSLLTLGATILRASYDADLYWSGGANPDRPPCWELVLPVPVTVLGLLA
jgi:hypothetical protein